MERHMGAEHGMGEVWSCPFCEKKFRNRKDNLLRHIRANHDPNWSFRKA
jgi:uncharacterized C2H2 Zn-finger protein